MLRKYKGVLVAIPVGAAFTVTNAHAALPAALTDALGVLATDTQALMDQYWPIIVPITIGFVLISLFKRGSRKV